MDSNLLKEAIADAKAVRQTALANAKAALEEAFSTRVEAILSEKLDEETAESMETHEGHGDHPTEESVNESDIQDIIAELESELPQDSTAPAPTPVDATAPAPAPAPAPAMGDAAASAPPTGAPAPAPAPAPVAPTPAPVTPEYEEMEESGPMEGTEETEELDEEIDVNALLESLRADEAAEEDMEECYEEVNESAPVKTSGIGGSKAGGADNKEPSGDAFSSSHIEHASVDKVGGGEGYKSGPADPTTAKRPNQGKNATKTNLSTPGGALKESSGTPGYSEGAKRTSKDPSEANRPNQGEHATKDDLSTPGGALKEENVKLKAQLQEAEQTITYVRGQLNEINLLNAKLLYTNRLFKEYSMDNQKKMKIVEMFDLAKNVREVKMTYAVIAESLNFGADFKKKLVSSAKIQNITEGMASQPVAGTAPKQIIAESAVSEMKSKFQKLAGIKVSKSQ